MSLQAPPGPPAMPDLRVREMEQDDFERCLHLLDGLLAYQHDTLALLPTVWRRLQDDEALNSVVIEARLSGGSQDVVGLGASVFVDDGWMAEALRGGEPYLTARTLKQEMTQPSPILRPAQIARANERGLNVLILHYAEHRGLPDETRQPLRYLMFESFVGTNRGYRIREVIQEFWDELAPEFVLNGWGAVRSDYAEYFQRIGEPVPSDGRRPYLIGVCRQEVESNPGSIAAPIFVHAPPRLGFTPAEKRMLRRAVIGMTDVELAEVLGVALPTVKSRWRNIYVRVALRAPELIPETSMSQHRLTRGQEKRRHVLDYLRRHPEELRPGLR